MRPKIKRKEERRMRRKIYFREMHRGNRVHIATLCIFAVWFLLLVVMFLLFLYVVTGNYIM